MFRTELTIAPETGQLARTARVLTMGSCFADSIGARLAGNKVDALVNPFGTVFQPLALARLLRAAAGEEVDWQQHLVEARGRWQSYDLHGSLGADSPVDLLQHIQELVRRTGEFLRSADVVLLTLGTAWAYRLRETGELVNNCHKQPADLFVRELLTPDEIINALAETHAYLRRINPNLRFVLTVSPVRHMKDTLPLNSVSKSVLRVATHIVSDLLPGVAYFPAYELLVDDLRDYRFYASDMLHPSEVAEDYIWEKFTRTYFDAEFGRFRKEWSAVRQSLGHRPLHAGAPEHRQFLQSTLEKLEQLSLRKVGVAAELQQVRTQLAALPMPRQPEPVMEIEDGEERIDIGEGSTVSAVPRVDTRASEVADEAEATLQAAVAQSAAAEGRPPRLSPEEFRAQRAARSGRPERSRRDGRGKGQQAVPSETEQFQTAAFADEVVEAAAIVPDARVESLTALESVLDAQIESGAASIAGNDADLEPAKKKKRRSRGGAKRTARKHALRAAAEGGLPVAEGTENADDSAESIVNSGGLEQGADARPEGRKSSVITKSVPVKRGGRRDDAGRVPRVPLFAAPAVESADTELPAPAIALPAEVATVAEVLNETPVTSVEAAGTPSKSRNSRNRKKKGTAKVDTALSLPVGGNADAGAVLTTPVFGAAIGTAEQLSGTPEPTAFGVDSSAAQTVSEAISPNNIPLAVADVAAVSEPVVASVVAARKPSRAKSRVISGGRLEKPAVDTPVVPVPDPALVRTQVAAGRLMGSSATLVEPTTPLKKPAASVAKKPAVSKATPSKAAPVEVVPAKPAAKAKAVLPKAKPVKTVLEPVPEVLEATLELAPAKPEKPQTKAKPAAKSKAAIPKAAVVEAVPEVAPVKAVPAKATAKKAPAKPVAAKVAAPKAVAKPKAATAKATAAKPAAAKPKPPKKPTKSA